MAAAGAAAVMRSEGKDAEVLEGRYACQNVVGRQDAAEGEPHRSRPHRAAERMAVIPN